MTSAGVLGESRPDGILANTTVSLTTNCRSWSDRGRIRLLRSFPVVPGSLECACAPAMHLAFSAFLLRNCLTVRYRCQFFGAGAGLSRSLVFGKSGTLRRAYLPSRRFSRAVSLLLLHRTKPLSGVCAGLLDMLMAEWGNSAG